MAVYSILPPASLRTKHVTAVDPVANMSCSEHAVKSVRSGEASSSKRSSRRAIEGQSCAEWSYIHSGYTTRHLVARVDVDALVRGREGVAHGLLGAELLGKVDVQLA